MSNLIATSSKTHVDELKRSANELLRQRRLAQAEEVCRKIIEADPEAPDGWVFLARADQQKNDFSEAFQHTRRAVSLSPDRLDVKLVAAEASIYVGHIADALTMLTDIGQRADNDTVILKQLCALYTQLNRHEAAYRTARRVSAIDPQSLNFKYLLSSTAIAVGRMDDAEDLLNQVIKILPEEGDIYYHRATLKKQTKVHNHISELEERLALTPKNDDREIPLSFALGKELEDLGNHKDAFAAYARGANARRARLAYDVAGDVKAADFIRETFDENWWSGTPAGADIQGPVFVLGLPRSGTTLVDRILSAHSAVTSLGEVNDFAYAVVRAGFPADSKNDLIRHSAETDMAALGNAFWQALRGYGEVGPHLIDKTPANFLYLGLIAKALPRARIIHVRRHPMASGFAMYKTLFRMGYPFSYDLTDIGRYYVSYHRLMSHWLRLFPDRIITVNYENLIDDQEGVSRALIERCGLEWEEDCLNFHLNAAPTATASATQVRNPIYREARDLWRVHETALKPLAEILSKNGVALT